MKNYVLSLEFSGITATTIKLLEKVFIPESLTDPSVEARLFAALHFTKVNTPSYMMQIKILIFPKQDSWEGGGGEN